MAIKSIVGYCIYLLTSVFILLLILEVCLIIANSVSSNTKFETLGKENHSKFGDVPKDHLGIAVFGGSAAFGWGSEASFDQILTLELRERYPTLKFRVDNLAETGEPFQRRQAVLLEHVFDKYDIFLIYAGNNEANYHYVDNGYFTNSEAIPHKERQYNPGRFNLHEWLRSHSHLFALTQKLHFVWVRPFLSNEDKRVFWPESVPIPSSGVPKLGYWRNRPKSFEDEPAISAESMAGIYRNYSEALESIGRRADKSRKSVIVSSVPYHENYPPHFSVNDANLTKDDSRTFHDLFKHGAHSFEQGAFELSTTSLLAAAAIDNSPAILSYMLGQAYMQSDQKEKGRSYIQKSVDTDGLYKRATSDLFDVTRSVSAKYENMHTVDSIQVFREALDAGISNNMLFGDYHHPSFLGHILIAQSFMSTLQKIPPFNRLDYPTIEPLFNKVYLENLDTRFRERLSIHDRQTSKTEYELAIWHYSQAAHYADPADILDFGKQHVEQYYEHSEKTTDEQALRLMTLALLETQNANLDRAQELVFQANALSSVLVSNFLYGTVYINGDDFSGNWITEFHRHGVDPLRDAWNIK